MFRRQGMEGEQCRHDAYRLRGCERLRGFQHLYLVRRVEPVAGLDLDRGHPALHQGMKARPRCVGQGVEACLACRLHRREDAAAGAGDLLIAGAVQPLLEFSRAIASEDEMRVAIDQARRDPGAAQLLEAACAIAGQLDPAADADDSPLVDTDGGVLDDSERARHGRVHRRDMAIAQQPVPHRPEVGQLCPRDKRRFSSGRFLALSRCKAKPWHGNRSPI